MSDGAVRVEKARLSCTVSKLQQQWYHRIQHVAEVEALEIVDRIVPWSPASAHEIELSTGLTVSIANVLDRVKKSELKIGLFLGDRITVSGRDLKWPGIPEKIWLSELELDLGITKESTTIKLRSIPYGFSESWNDCIHLLIRLASWLGN